jgi:hypothetical protein
MIMTEHLAMAFLIEKLRRNRSFLFNITFRNDQDRGSFFKVIQTRILVLCVPPPEAVTRKPVPAQAGISAGGLNIETV